MELLLFLILVAMVGFFPALGYVALGIGGILLLMLIFGD